MERPLAERQKKPPRLLFLLFGGCGLLQSLAHGGCTTPEKFKFSRENAASVRETSTPERLNTQTLASAQKNTTEVPQPLARVSHSEVIQASAPITLSDPQTPMPTPSVDAAQGSDEPNSPVVIRSEAIESSSRDAAPPSTNGELIEYFVEVALANHPRIDAARQRVAAANNVIPQADALPDPNFKNTFWPIRDQALQTAAGRMAHQMSLSQQIPFPKKLQSKARIASREAQVAFAELEAVEREIAEAVQLAFYEVWFNSRAIEILELNKDLVEDLEEVAESRYKAGGTQQDVLRAQLEYDRLEMRVIELQKQKAFAQADLASLLQQPVSLVPEAKVELDTIQTPTDIRELIALAEQCNPSLRGLNWKVTRDREKQRLACLQKYPDFNLGMQWGLIDDDSVVVSPVANGHDNMSFSFGTTLPIWRDKIRAGIREANHRTASTARLLDATRDEIHGKLRRLLAQADALIEQRNLYRDRIVPRTEDTLRLAIADYRGGRTDFFNLIDTYRELLMYETQLARIEASLAGTVAQIDRTVGCSVGCSVGSAID